MIYKAESPVRISLFGGSTDFLSYSNKFGGLVVNTSIDYYQKIRLFTGNDRTALENTNMWLLDDDNEELFKKLYEVYNIRASDVKLEHECEVNIRSGLGSSAALIVAFIKALSKLRHDPERNSFDIAKEAWKFEVNEMGILGGIQDQLASAWEGMNIFEMSKRGIYRIPVTNGVRQKILNSIILIYTGISKKSSTTQNHFRHLESSEIEYLHKIKKIAETAVNIIEYGDIEKLGYLLHESWELKSKFNKVSNSKIDRIYARVKKLGVYGGKLCGSGGGGYMFFMVPPHKKANIIEKIENKYQVLENL